MKRNKFLLLNYVFVVSIILLFINDHFLKLYFHNWFTGKFSDFLGMIIFPLFLAYVFPKLRTFSILVSFILFIFLEISVFRRFYRFLQSDFAHCCGSCGGLYGFHRLCIFGNSFPFDKI